MGERLSAGMKLTAERLSLPVSQQDTALSLTVATSMHPDAASGNARNLRQLYDYQRATDESCFFVALYAMSMALYPDRPLPDADRFLSEIRPQYGGENGILEPDKLLVRNDRLAQALDIYETWGMRVKRIERNAKAQDLLKISLQSYEDKGLVTDTRSYTSLKLEDYTPPFAVWMHEGVTNQAHFVTVDGSPEAMEMLADYEQNKKYFVKMVIEIERKEGWEGEWPDGHKTMSGEAHQLDTRVSLPSQRFGLANS